MTETPKPKGLKHGEHSFSTWAVSEPTPFFVQNKIALTNVSIEAKDVLIASASTNCWFDIIGALQIPQHI
jgi:hypothetical protein